MKMELLAPAGSSEALFAAVAAGADAVYLGGTLFGARAYAKNLTREELLSAIDYVHLHGRKLYLTVNTLLKDAELTGQLYEYLLPLYERGLDAVIVQDFGVLSAVRRWFPDLPIHASTQMTVTGAAGARFLERRGVTRVVPARELSLAEIAKIRKTTKLEIECFVHGALCYCYSGQCLFSSLIGGRSGNRGRCAQPCRLPYEAWQENRRLGEEGDRFLLSPRDMCALELLPYLQKAGIRSLKIEGRMKRPEYTAGVVSIYRRYLDLLEEKPGAFRVLPEDRKRLELLYSREGFNQGYYRTRNGREMMALGKEKEDNPRRTAKYEQLLYELRRDYLEEPLRRKIEGYASLYPGQPAALSLWTGDTSVTVEEGCVENALSRPLTEEEVRAQLIRTGETPFSFRELTVAMDENVFVPVQTLKTLRRKAAEALEEALAAPFRRRAPKSSGEPNAGGTDAGGTLLPETRENREEEKVAPPKLRAAADTRKQLYTLLECGGIDGVYASIFCFSKERFADQAAKTLAEAGQAGKKLYLALPHAVREGELNGWREEFRELIREGLSGFLVRNLESFAVLAEMGLSGYAVLDSSVYTQNREALRFWQKEGILRDTAPLEMNAGELASRGVRDSELVVYGRLPMMVSAQCVKKNLDRCTGRRETVILRDRYGKEFPVKCYCDTCYNVIYNSLPMALFGEADAVLRLRPGALRLVFTTEEPDEIRAAVSAAVRAFVLGAGAEMDGEYTKGHFRRKVE